MDKLTANERCQYRGWSVDYSLSANTRRNMFCAIEEVAPIEKVMADSQTIYDFISRGNEVGQIHSVQKEKK